MIYIKKNKRAFTLIEIILAVSIFALMTVVIAGIYLAFSRLQLESRASQRLLNDSQYALEMMVKEIRNNLIFDFAPQDIDCQIYLGTGFSDCIFLLREEGILTAFSLKDGNELHHIILSCDDNYENCSFLRDASAVLLAPDFNNISVEELDFYIRPQFNPYISDTDNIQPRVTIRLKVKYDSERASEQVSHNLQTTVSSRIYNR